MKIFCSLLAACSILVAHHVLDKDVEPKRLSPEVRDLCELGAFHPDCEAQEVH